jgi:hypothetical protein
MEINLLKKKKNIYTFYYVRTHHCGLTIAFLTATSKPATSTPTPTSTSTTTTAFAGNYSIIF